MLPSEGSTRSMLARCEDHYQRLVSGGCDSKVALDRTWDAFEGVYSGRPCFDGRDRDFQSELQEIAERG